MDLPGKFVTNVGLVTSDGPYGPDVMAAEWTYYISYEPPLIAVHINPKHATYVNIKATKEFGVGLASTDQNVLASVAGGYTAREVDKVAALKELGVEFYKAKKISVLLVKGAAMNAECRLVKKLALGDHRMVIGEGAHVTGSEKSPLALHDGKYWKLTERVAKPGQDVLDRIEAVI